MSDCIFISADHGTAIVYFLQSDVVNEILDSGIQVVLLTDDETRDHIARRFSRPGLVIEGLRLEAAEAFARTHLPRVQWLLGYLRRVGGSWRMNTAAMDSHIREVWAENSWKFRLGVWIPATLAVLLLRTFPLLRKWLIQVQMRYRPHPGLYADLFAQYRPRLVVASTPGWRLDRYLLREAQARGIPTMATIVGWDNPSSYAIGGSIVDRVSCWSRAQKAELIVGSDWDPRSITIGGIPSYDGYVNGRWRIPRAEYFRKHNLDPARRLISYASSFVHFAPNYPNIEALTRLVSSDALAYPAQLLVRLHPSHFQEKPAIFAEERRRVVALQRQYPYVHVVQPVPLGGSLGYYGGEDMDEKDAMMAYSDIVVTVYSTMLVETAVHATPMVAAVIDVPGGWNVRGKFSLALRDIGNWPTHQRFLESGAGSVARDVDQLRAVLDAYLQAPHLDAAARQDFVQREITFADGTAGKRTAANILQALAESRHENGSQPETQA